MIILGLLTFSWQSVFYLLKKPKRKERTTYVRQENWVENELTTKKAMCLLLIRLDFTNSIRDVQQSIKIPADRRKDRRDT